MATPAQLLSKRLFRIRKEGFRQTIHRPSRLTAGYAYRPKPSALREGGGLEQLAKDSRLLCPAECDGELAGDLLLLSNNMQRVIKVVEVNVHDCLDGEITLETMTLVIDRIKEKPAGKRTRREAELLREIKLKRQLMRQGAIDGILPKTPGGMASAKLSKWIGRPSVFRAGYVYSPKQTGIASVDGLEDAGRFTQLYAPPEIDGLSGECKLLVLSDDEDRSVVISPGLVKDGRLTPHSVQKTIEFLEDGRELSVEHQKMLSEFRLLAKVSSSGRKS